MTLALPWRTLGGWLDWRVMADLTSALLCDFAQVREGVLFVSSGGVSRLTASRLPCPFAMHLALLFEIPSDEIGNTFRVNVTVAHAPTAQVGGTAEAKLSTRSNDTLLPGEALMVPMAVDLRPIEVKQPGPHDVRINVDGQLARFLTINVLTPAQT